MSKFQLIITLLSITIVFLAVLVLSGVIPGLPGGSSGEAVSLSMWGYLPQKDLINSVGILNDDNRKDFSVNYTQKKKDNYEQELLNALASGTGPDIWITTQDSILNHRDKMYLIPYEVFKERDFRNTFIDVAELFLWKPENEEVGGIMSVPFLVDPIVMYWNKDLFNKEGIAQSPVDWNEFMAFSRTLTKKDSGSGFIIQSGAAMGEFDNINNAKDLFSLLVLQSGEYESALNFYVNFSNPSKVSYSWNRALPNSKDMFIRGQLAMYFGYVSEMQSIKEGNPHLNFDMTMVPQMEDALFEATFSRVYSLAIFKSSQNINAAIKAVFGFVDKDVSEQLEKDTSFSSSRRNLADGNKTVLQSRAWLEPDPEKVSEIYKNMIESVVTGKKRVSEAVSDMETLLEALLQEVK